MTNREARRVQAAGFGQGLKGVPVSENGTRRRASSEEAMAAARARGRELATAAPAFTPDQRDLIGRVWVPALAVDEQTDGAA